MTHALPAGLDEVVAPPGEDELPYDFGPPMDSDIHRDNFISLVMSARAYFAHVPDVYVSGDMAMYFSELQAKNNDFVGPDVFVVTETSKRPRKSWVMWQELRAPDLVIEITSPTTEHRDRGDKMRIYGKILRVPEYFVYDPATGRLDAWRLVGSDYQPVAPSGDGWFPSAFLPLGLRVVEADYAGEKAWWLRWTDGRGALIPLAEERARAAEADAADAKAEAADAKAEAAKAETEAADAKAEAADAKAEAADAKAEAARLAAKLRALGIDPDAT